jgi:hypothetical protein
MTIKSEAVLTSYNEARDSSVRARRELYLIELVRSNYTCNINTQQLTHLHTSTYYLIPWAKKNLKQNINFNKHYAYVIQNILLLAIKKSTYNWSEYCTLLTDCPLRGQVLFSRGNKLGLNQ